MAQNRRTKNSNTFSDFSYVLYLLLPLIFLAPYFRGLFFDEELVVAHMFTAIVAGIYFYFNKDQIKLSRNLLDYAGAGLVLAYLLSSFVAFNTRDGIGDLLKYLNYFLVYYLIVKTAANIPNMRKVMWTIFTSGIGVAFIGLGSAYGTFNYNGAYVDGLISSTLQYHNAAAIYLVATGIVGLYLAITTESLGKKMLITAGNYLTFITAFGAGSRGALLVAPAALLLQFIGLPKSEKLKYFYGVLAFTIPFVSTAKGALSFANYSEGYHWGMLFLGLILSCVMELLMSKSQKFDIKIKKSHIIATVGVLVLAISILAIVKGSGIMPTSIMDRAKNINLSDNNVKDRFYFYKDAMKIIKDHPVLGVGGGGWNSIYRQYQSYFYNSSEVHSHPLQVWVESGTVGFAFYVMLWIALFILMIKILRTKKDVRLKTLSWSAFSATFALGVHSCIDFTFSLGAPMILLWTLFGLVRSTDEQLSDSAEKYNLNIKLNASVRRVIGITLMGVFFLISTSFFIANKYASNANDYYNDGDISKAIDYLKTATTFDPFNYENFYNLSVMFVQVAENNRDKQMLAYSLESAKDAVKNNKGDSQTRMMLARAYINSGDLANGVSTAEQAVSLAPFVTDIYSELAQVYNFAANYYAKNGNIPMSKELAEKVISLPQTMKIQAAKLDENGRKLFKGSPLDQVSPALQMEIQKAQDMKARI